MREHDQAEKRAAHARHQRERLRPPVRVDADQRLQQRGGQLKRQGDQSDLAEVQTVGGLDEWIDGRQQRLHHVVQQMREAERHNDREHAGLDGRRCGLGRRRFLHVLSYVRCARWSRQNYSAAGDYALRPTSPQARSLMQNERAAGIDFTYRSGLTSGSRFNTAVASNSLLPCATSMRNMVSAWLAIGMARCWPCAASCSISRSLSTWRA